MVNEILIYGEVGTETLSAQTIKAQLATFDAADELVVRIDSPGGSVFQGFSIFQAFQEYPGPKRCIIESAAFSIASYIAMAFDDISIAGNGYLMIHNPSVVSEGDDEQHAKDADLLNKLKQSMVEAYSNRTGISEDNVRLMMKQETYLNAIEANQQGFVSSVLDNAVQSRIVAKKDRMPYRVVASLFSDSSVQTLTKPKELVMAEDNKPVSAGIKEIRLAFPKMSDKFILDCLMKGMPMASVAGAAAEELLKENEELKARIAAMEEEQEAMEEEKESARTKASEEEETANEDQLEEETARAAARGATAIARPGSRRITAKCKWDEAIDIEVKRGLPRAKAVQQANKKNPGLRAEYLAEVNVR